MLLGNVLHQIEVSFFMKKHGILKNLTFDKNCSRIYKNWLTYKFCTISEWDKCQQFSDFIKFIIVWFVLTKSCKKCVLVFLDQTLYTAMSVKNGILTKKMLLKWGILTGQNLTKIVTSLMIFGILIQKVKIFQNWKCRVCKLKWCTTPRSLT